MEGSQQRTESRFDLWEFRKKVPSRNGLTAHPKTKSLHGFGDLFGALAFHPSLRTQIVQRDQSLSGFLRYFLWAHPSRKALTDLILKRPQGFSLPRFMERGKGLQPGATFLFRFWQCSLVHFYFAAPLCKRSIYCWDTTILTSGLARKWSGPHESKREVAFQHTFSYFDAPLFLKREMSPLQRNTVFALTVLST